MSVRTYFSFRYTLPGYTFLTVILLINLEYLISEMQIISDSIGLFGILLSFLSLLSGSAIGFLISQIWYIIYNFIIKNRYIFLRRRDYALLSRCVETDDIVRLISIMHYSLVMFSKERTREYINRLTDMINSLLSTLLAISFGMLFGYYINIEVFHQSLFSNYDLLIYFSLVFFGTLLFFNALQVWIEHDSVCHLIIELNQERIKYEFLER